MNDVSLVKAPEITPGEPVSAPPPRETIGPFLTAKLGAFRERLAGIKPRLLASGDAEAVHDLRVGLRRARTVLAIGRPVFGRHYADQVRAAFREVHQATGALRDEEVLLELIAALDAGPEWPEVHAWLDVRRRRERSLRARLRRMVQAGALDSGLRLLDALLLFQVKPSRDRRLTKFARRAIDEAKRKVERGKAIAEEAPETLHELRVLYKGLRYTAETFAEAHGMEEAAAGVARSASRFQSLLGKVHDAEVADGAVRRSRGLSDATRATLLRQLALSRETRLQAYDRARGASDVRTAPRPLLAAAASPGSSGSAGESPLRKA
jgi:CHAD domain-containing protein